MAVQKKHGKGRLDKWYKLAKEKGYRARAAFKLIQLNKKYGFLENSKVLLDLCAAPGSWCQVAAETMPANSIIVGVDLSPIKPIPKVITFQSDITTDKCRATIRQHLKTWKADTVLHDGAPNVGTAWVQDSFNQAELALQSMKLATEFLVEGGTFVTKVFRSKDYNALLWVFNQLFTKVEATKPPSSRNVSAEIFVVCRGFKAPKHIDPRFLDPKSVFAELADPTPNNEAKVFHPEIKKRKRDGYEEGNYILFKEMTASAFIQTTDPIAVLGECNRLTFDQPPNGDVALAALDKMPETTDEIRQCCADLKLLSKKDFSRLLKWRLQVRDIFGLPKKAAAAPLADVVAQEQASVQVDTLPEDEDTRMDKALQELKTKVAGKRKREKRRENERKQKEIVRMQMNMTAPMDIGMEQADAMGDGAMFALKKLNETAVLQRIARGKMATLSASDTKAALNSSAAVSAAVAAAAAAKRDRDSGIGSSGDTDDDSNAEEDDDEDNDDEEDRLERELDGLYDSYQERKAAADAKYRAKKARQENDDEWEGLSAAEDGRDSDLDDSDSALEEEDSSDDEDGDTAKTSAKKKAIPSRPLLTDLDNQPEEEGGLSKRARRFFEQDIFKDITGVLDEEEEVEEQETEEVEVEEAEADEEEEDEEDEDEEEEEEENAVPNGSRSAEAKSVKSANGWTDSATQDESESEAEGGFEVVKHRSERMEDDWEEEDKRRRSDGRLDIDIITAEAMTMAHQLATGQTLKQDVVDDGFNKHAFRDKDGLPEWFLDDESRHDKPQRPMTAAAAAAIKEKMRAFNARPIKKVREAQARKKFKAAQRLEKLKKKSESLIADEGMTEKEKGDTISKMLRKATKKKPHVATKVVVARGANRGIKGRPKGVKGRYKLVDPRMKKETRALKRIAKKHK